MNEYDIQKALQRIERELIGSMMRNMQRHRAEERKEGFEWTMWQAEQLRALEEYKQRNKEQYKEKFLEINRSIPTIIQKARKRGYLEQEAEILEAIGKGYSAKYSGEIQGAFFVLNDRKMNALIDATVSDMEKAETAMLRKANDEYRKIIFNAQVYANSGVGTYEKAVDLATKDFLSAGIQCVQYKNGAMHRIDRYAGMAIKTASKRSYLTGEGEKRKEWGCHLVIMNKRGNPCPKCLPFVGKILIDDVWSGGSRSDGNYPLMSAAMNAGLYHPNCKDGHTTYFPGISTPPNDRFSKKEIKQIKEEYKQDQKRQYAERQEEKFGRLADNSLDEENKERYRLKQEKWKGMKETDHAKEQKESESLLVKINQMGYNEDKIWELTQSYIQSVQRGMISPMSGFQNYMELYKDIDEKIIGIVTPDGIEITSQSKHFIERVIGTMEDPKTKSPRSGVTIEAAMEALKNPIKMDRIKIDSAGRKSKKYIGRQATVSIDPENGNLIQCNPTDGDLVRRLDK